jgi:hypothetical protein
MTSEKVANAPKFCERKRRLLDEIRQTSDKPEDAGEQAQIYDKSNTRFPTT